MADRSQKRDDFFQMQSHTDEMTFYLNTLSKVLTAGDLTARELIETCLEAIASEEGNRAFMEVYSNLSLIHI